MPSWHGAFSEQISMIVAERDGMEQWLAHLPRNPATPGLIPGIFKHFQWESCRCCQGSSTSH